MLSSNALRYNARISLPAGVLFAYTVQMSELIRGRYGRMAWRLCRTRLLGGQRLAPSTAKSRAQVVLDFGLNEQLFENLGDVNVILGRCLDETVFPVYGNDGFGRLGGDLESNFITSVRDRLPRHFKRYGYTNREPRTVLKNVRLVLLHPEVSSGIVISLLPFRHRDRRAGRSCLRRRLWERHRCP